MNQTIRPRNIEGFFDGGSSLRLDGDDNGDDFANYKVDNFDGGYSGGDGGGYSGGDGGDGGGRRGVVVSRRPSVVSTAPSSQKVSSSKSETTVTLSNNYLQWILVAVLLAILFLLMLKR